MGAVPTVDAIKARLALAASCVNDTARGACLRGKPCGHGFNCPASLLHLAIRDLCSIFAKVCRDFEAELVECSGEDDHVHLLVRSPPKVALSKLVNSLKGVSSRRLRETRPEVSGRYHDGVLWSASYFAASCGGAPLSVIAECVRSQREGTLPPRPERRGSRAVME